MERAADAAFFHGALAEMFRTLASNDSWFLGAAADVLAIETAAAALG
jgi:hypothetical protein